MNDEFITEALENDRLLKAIRLVDRFETEIEGELRRVADEFVRENTALFDDNVDRSFKLVKRPNPVITHARVLIYMDRVSSLDDRADELKLVITLRWLDPAEYGFSETDGALCVAAYKINNANSDDHTRVEQQSRANDWDVGFCRDAYDKAPGIVYVPVETAEEIRSGFETLTEHFSTFGSEYGVVPDASD